MYRCPSCDRSYGGATVEASAVCLSCLAELDEVHRLVPEAGDEQRPPLGLQPAAARSALA